MNWRARSRLKCPKDNLMTSSHPQSRPPQPSASPEQRGWSYRWAVAGLQAERRAGTRTEILLLSCLAPSKHPTSLLPHLISQLPYGQPVFKSLPVLPQLPPPHTNTQQKLPRGLPPAAHQGELFRTASLRDPTDETPNTSTFCLSLFFSFNHFYFPLPSSPQMDVRVGMSGGQLKSSGWRGEGRGYDTYPAGLGGGELSWFTGAEIFFFFRNLVAWFSYLSQYIFTYLLLKWIPLQLMKKIL